MSKINTQNQGSARLKLVGAKSKFSWKILNHRDINARYNYLLHNSGFGFSNFHWGNVVFIISDTTSLNSGWSKGCITILAELLGDKWKTLPLMCTFHGAERLVKHQLDALSYDIFGLFPKMTAEESSTTRSLQTIGYNMKYLYDKSDLFDVLKTRFPSVEFEFGVEHIDTDKRYQGTDNDMTFLSGLVSKRVFDAAFIFRAPVTMGGRWKAEIRNNMQGIICKPYFEKIDTENVVFRDTARSKINGQVLKLVFRLKT